MEPLFIANKFIPGGEQHTILPAREICGSRDVKGLFRKTGIQLTFTDKESQMANSFLESMGVTKEKIVCLIARDSSYLKNADYHDYRDVHISTFKEAALALAKKGYWVFRMGKIVNMPFKSDHPHILDYANSKYRSDFLDIWLMANCYFCISSGTGLDEVPRIFRRPAVYVNYLTTSNLVTYDHVITTPKHLVWQETNRKLTLLEHLTHAYSRTKQYKNANILVEALTEKEILQAVLEIEARLSGSWEESEEDRQLQEKFWEIFKSDPNFQRYNGKIHPEARVGTDFLRNNPEWLN